MADGFRHPFINDRRWKRLREGLTNLGTKGVDPYRIIERTPFLLNFEVVRARGNDSTLPDTFDRLPTALSDVLREIAEAFREDYRLMLHIVFGFDEDYTDRQGEARSLLDMAASERYTLAGQEFRGPRGVVGPDTIRLNHLPRSLDRMAVEFLRQEMEYTGFWPLGASAPLGPDPAMPRCLPGDLVLESGNYEVNDVSGVRLGQEASLVKGEEFPEVAFDSAEFGWKLQPEVGV